MQFVYGLSRNGESFIKYFIKNNINFNCWDDNLKIRKKIKKLYPNIKFINPKLNILNKYEKIYISPGISIRQKKFEKIKNNKIKLGRDLNLYSDNITNQKLIAITGTNGKSTTTKLIGDIFKKSKISIFVGGNLGTPLLNSFLANKKYTHHAIELSSFQLELIDNFNSYVSILLNISKDHLDRYNNFNDYIKQKKKIFTNNGFGFNIISLDDPESFKLFNSKKIKNKISFSIINKKADIFYNNNKIYDNFFYKNKKIEINKISNYLIGQYNKQNILAGYIVSKIFKIPLKIYKEVIKNFVGLPHRGSIIKNNNKFIAINNSKATNVDSAYKSIQNLNDVYLILGGRAKEKNFEKIKQMHKNIKEALIYGESSKFISKQIESKISVKIFDKLEQVISYVFSIIKYN